MIDNSFVQGYGRKKMTREGYSKLKGALKANPGGLHRSLGIPEGQKIPAHRLTAALHSKNPRVRKQANLAKVAKGFKH